jgi:putative acetyltransferase
MRHRTEADWPQLLDLWVASWRATYPEIDFQARCPWLTQHIKKLESNGAVTLCQLEETTNKIAGFVVINPETGWLDQICVGPDHFSKGYGEALLLAAKELSAHRVCLDVNADNNRAVRFYLRNGFTKIGEGSNSLSGRATLMLEWKKN